MTIEKLLGMSAAELEKMSDAELTEWFKPMFAVTRPAKDHKEKIAQKSESKIIARDAKQDAFKKGLELLAAKGIDISALLGKKK